MKKPIIGIVPLVDREKESYWMLPVMMPLAPGVFFFD